MPPKGFVMCYVCGRDFGVWSIGFHEPQCLQKWKNENNNRHPHQRLPVPRKPGGHYNSSGASNSPSPSSSEQDIQRPKTAILDNPRVLNAEHAKDYDMTGQRVSRPYTITLPRPTPNIRIPHIATKKLEKTRKKKHAKGLGHEAILALANRDQPPEPCTSCGRNSFPERFHSHPVCTPFQSRSKSRTMSRKFKNIEEFSPEENNLCEDNNVNFRNSHLVPCPNCGRTFFPDRLPVHLRGCREKTGTKQALQSLHTSNSPDSDVLLSEPPRRKLILCYICGRQFGSKSISIHEPQCLKKWQAENSKLPKNLQRPEPRKPDLIHTADGAIDLDALAEAAWQTHLEQLIPCGKCGRRFNADRLEIHSRVCQGTLDKKR